MSPLNHPVFGQLKKKYSEAGCDIYCSADKIWVVMIKDHVVGFTWKGYNGFVNVRESISKIIQYYASPQTAIWI